MSDKGRAETGIRIEREGALVEFVLDRPRALNALNFEMRAAVASALAPLLTDAGVYALCMRSATGRAFCVGGDVRELVAWARDDVGRAKHAFAEEYRLNWVLECFRKPAVALIDGMVIGSGVGLTAFLTHRVAGENYRFSMPETAIGLFPDVGAAHVLARLPDSIGMYLGLTGGSIGRADAFALGLVTHCIPREHFDDITSALADAWPIDDLLDARHTDPGPRDLIRRRRFIGRCFSAPSVEEILERLEKADGPDGDWAGPVASKLRTCSPTSLKITHRHLQLARSTDLRETLIRDNRLAAACLDNKDFHEGVRALLIDKDNKPAWSPASLAEVSDERVDAYFQPPASGDLDLPMRDMTLPALGE